MITKIKKLSLVLLLSSLLSGCIIDEDGGFDEDDVVNTKVDVSYEARKDDGVSKIDGTIAYRKLTNSTSDDVDHRAYTMIKIKFKEDFTNWTFEGFYFSLFPDENCEIFYQVYLASNSFDLDAYKEYQYYKEIGDTDMLETLKIPEEPYYKDGVESSELVVGDYSDIYYECWYQLESKDFCIYIDIADDERLYFPDVELEDGSKEPGHVYNYKFGFDEMLLALTEPIE